ncbi:MAG: flagellar export protein FliJ [Planctomycetota bacterium]|jgi:flagellar FliJ protein
MAKFRFKLEPLLKARKRAEERHQLTVAGMERERLALEEKLRRQQDAIGQSKKTWRGSLVGRIDIASLRLQAASALGSVRQAQQLVLQLAGVHQRLEAARCELIEATKARRAIERLKERRFERWKTDLEKAETARLDELATNGAAARGVTMEREP